MSVVAATSGIATSLFSQSLINDTRGQRRRDATDGCEHGAVHHIDKRCFAKDGANQPERIEMHRR